MKFSLLGCKIYVSYYCFTLLAAVLVLDIAKEMLFCLLAALIHELGHLIPLIYFSDKRPKSIDITPFGATIKTNAEFAVATSERMVCFLSGPFVNIITFTLIFIINESNMSFFALQNLFLGLFNLLPIRPLDGSCILEEILRLNVKSEKVDWICEIVSFVFLIPLFTYGFIIIFNSANNFCFLFISVYLMFLFLSRNRR